MCLTELTVKIQFNPISKKNYVYLSVLYIL